MGQVNLETSGPQWSPSMTLYRKEGDLVIIMLFRSKLLNNVKGVLKENLQIFKFSSPLKNKKHLAY